MENNQAKIKKNCHKYYIAARNFLILSIAIFAFGIIITFLFFSPEFGLLILFALFISIPIYFFFIAKGLYKRGAQRDGPVQKFILPLLILLILTVGLLCLISYASESYLLRKYIRYYYMTEELTPPEGDLDYYYHTGNVYKDWILTNYYNILLGLGVIEFMSILVIGWKYDYGLPRK